MQGTTWMRSRGKVGRRSSVTSPQPPPPPPPLPRPTSRPRSAARRLNHRCRRRLEGRPPLVPSHRCNSQGDMAALPPLRPGHRGVEAPRYGRSGGTNWPIRRCRRSGRCFKRSGALCAGTQEEKGGEVVVKTSRPRGYQGVGLSRVSVTRRKSAVRLSSHQSTMTKRSPPPSVRVRSPKGAPSEPESSHRQSLAAEAEERDRLVANMRYLRFHARRLSDCGRRAPAAECR